MTIENIPSRPIYRLFDYIRPFKQHVFWSALASCLNKILDLMPPLLVAWVIDTVRGDAPAWILTLSGSSDPWTLAMFLSIMGVGIFVLESVFQWAYQYGFQTLAQKAQHRLRLDTYNHLQHREMAFFENHRVGNTLSILNDDVNQLETFLNTIFNELIQLVILILFATSVMFSTSWPLALFALTPVPFVIVGSLWYQRRISPKYQLVRDAVGSLNSRLENNISGIPVIKSFTAEEFESSRVQESSEHYLRQNFKAIRFNTLYVPLIRMAVAFGFSGVLLIGSFWILEGKSFLTVGQLVLFSMIIQRLLWPLTRLGAVLDSLERAGASARRIFGLLDTPSPIKEPKNPTTNPVLKGNLSYKNVFFSYENGLQILNGLSFDVKAGQTIGIAGTTGSGKSTLIKTLLRLYDIQDGSITLDGTSITDFKLKDLRRQIALVSQDVYLFHGTILENIAYGMPDAKLDDIQRAAELSEFDSFVQTLPDKYDSIVGEKGIKLSGGQRQRLSIARAILKDAPIIVLDEATSSVDTETERAIQKNLDQLTTGKTALVIAHRLSTIRYADQILVLSNGHVTESGTHDQLIKQKGTYADLWSIQIGEAKQT